MSETRNAFVSLVEEDPELRPLAPAVRIIFEAPDGSLAAFFSLAELWGRLKADRRALLAMTLDESLTVEQIARLALVHRRTLYKSEPFMRHRLRIRSVRPGSPPRGEKSSEGEFDAWEDD